MWVSRYSYVYSMVSGLLLFVRVISMMVMVNRISFLKWLFIVCCSCFVWVESCGWVLCGLVFYFGLILLFIEIVVMLICVVCSSVVKVRVVVFVVIRWFL